MSHVWLLEATCFKVVFVKRFACYTCAVKRRYPMNAGKSKVHPDKKAASTSLYRYMITIASLHKRRCSAVTALSLTPVVIACRPHTWATPVARLQYTVLPPAYVFGV